MSQPLRPRAERGVIRAEAAVFGRSVRGAPLEVYAPQRPSRGLLVVAGVHGEEGESVVLLSTALRSLPPGALAAHVVLALNPDGLARGTRGNANGVDLNRNFPATTWCVEPVAYRWTLEDPRDVLLSPGSAPLSEPETAAFVPLVERLCPSAILAIHAPLGCVDDPEGTALGAWLAEETDLPRVGDVGYETPGSMGTWGHEVGIPVVTWELPRLATEVLVRDLGSVLASVLAGDAPLP